MEEVWKDIEGYEGLYQVSNLGRVRSLDRVDSKGRHKCGQIMKLSLNEKGYVKITLWKNGKKKDYKVHRLVAQAFIPNPNNLPEVNHIIDDFEHRSDNRVENLEWCTHEYNLNYGNRSKRHSEAIKGRKLSEEHKRKIGEAGKGREGKKVICITTNEIFLSIMEASRKYNVPDGNINKCCKGERKSAGRHPITGEKLVWKYV